MKNIRGMVMIQDNIKTIKSEEIENKEDVVVKTITMKDILKVNNIIINNM